MQIEPNTIKRFNALVNTIVDNAGRSLALSVDYYTAYLYLNKALVASNRFEEAANLSLWYVATYEV